MVARYDRRIRRLDAPIADLDARIADLQLRIAHRRDRIAQLRSDFVEQRKAIHRLAGQARIAKLRLAQRVVTVYERGGEDDTTWLVGAEDVSDVLDRIEAAQQVVGLDQGVVESVRELDRKLRVERARNHDRQRRMQADIAGIARDEASVAAAREKLTSRRDQLAGVRTARASYLHQLIATDHKLDKDLDQVEGDSKALREVIRTGSTSFTGSTGAGISAAGLIWPVQRPIASPFGWRWGRMHEGLDIAVPTGVPIHAAASGIVTYAGWMQGYGNLVVIQHSGSLATAYGHQSQLGSHVGEFVQQGQVIGFVGCTGHCFGPHVHFETRVGGQAVDPMRYL